MRRLGVASGIGVAVVGLAYVLVIIVWLAIERTPRAPIGDPYLAIMEILTMASGLTLIGFFVAIRRFVDSRHQGPAVASLVLGSVAAGLTMAVHFVQLTAVRQLWRAGQIADYRLEWPSVLFAVEYLAWDFALGFAMVCAGQAFAGDGTAGSARLVLMIVGIMCLVGGLGPLTGQMALQFVAVFGYAIMLPIAGVFAARLFHVTPLRESTAA